MGKLSGEISVKMTCATAKAAADWISFEYLPAFRDSGPGLLGMQDRFQRRAKLRLLSDLSIRLEKISRRKAATKREFFRPLKRAAVITLLEIASVRRPSFLFGSETYLPFPSGPLRQSLEWMEDALATVGRPPMSVEARQAKIAGGHIDDRHRKRLKAEQRTHEELVRFIRNGGALLGGKIPLPGK